MKTEVKIIDLGAGKTIEQTIIDNTYIFSEVEMLNGERHGTVKIYRPNGGIRCISNFRHNKRHGSVTWFNDDNGIEVIYQYENGNLISTKREK